MPVTIKNRLNQPVLINVKGKNPLHLLARGIAEVSEKDLESSQLKTLISRGDVSIRTAEKPKGAEGKPKARKSE